MKTRHTVSENADGTLSLERDLPARGEVELVLDADHFSRVVCADMLHAKVSLDIATADFKAMLVPQGQRRAPSIVEHLIRMAKRGVEVRVLHAGVPSSAALHELRKALPRNLVIRRCPRLHTKAIVVDSATLYLGSANLTGAGLGAKAAHRRNFEAGVISQSPDLIDAVLHAFNRLWEGAHCEGCGRRDVCPVPLEEPALR